ncbi:uncharacterized protein LOC127291129 [Leptopilina boulardi]|uniref:uncharacterized protein LOC127291129 n=1 Tax=Leptopilina boulardi TaxID=63433 RepID=UPI0021F6049A|nr:uncharacterized protein LOC127291129 [Leptopilina boulardi]
MNNLNSIAPDVEKNSDSIDSSSSTFTKKGLEYDLNPDSYEEEQVFNGQEFGGENYRNTNTDNAAFDDEDELEIDDKATIRQLKRRIIVLETENRSLLKANIKMQKKVVDCFTQVQTTVNNISNSAQIELERKIYTGEELSVGEINESANQIHAGFGVWVDRDKYDTIRYSHKINTQKFIKRMASEIFGDDVLKASTVKGQTDKPALHVIGIEALKAISKYWMKEVRNMSDSDIVKELLSVTNYLNHKINDLNRTNRTPKKAKGVKRKQTDQNSKTEIKKQKKNSSKNVTKDGSKLKNPNSTVEKSKSDNKESEVNEDEIQERSSEKLEKDDYSSDWDSKKLSDAESDEDKEVDIESLEEKVDSPEPKELSDSDEN